MTSKTLPPNARAIDVTRCLQGHQAREKRGRVLAASVERQLDGPLPTLLTLVKIGFEEAQRESPDCELLWFSMEKKSTGDFELLLHVADKECVDPVGPGPCHSCERPQSDCDNCVL